MLKLFAISYVPIKPHSALNSHVPALRVLTPPLILLRVRIVVLCYTTIIILPERFWRASGTRSFIQTSASSCPGEKAAVETLCPGHTECLPAAAQPTNTGGE